MINGSVAETEAAQWTAVGNRCRGPLQQAAESDILMPTFTETDHWLLSEPERDEMARCQV